MNNNMYEEDAMLREKIAKREKKDAILSYILIVVLVLLIGIVLYLKFVKEDEYVPVEYEPNYISLNEIASSLNTSILANRYLNDGATFTSNVIDNSLNVSYVKDNTNINFGIPIKNNELVVTIDENNTEIVTDVYKEIAAIVCMYYGNSEDNCRYTLEYITTDSSISGIKIVNNNVYINITKSIDTSKFEYNTVTKTSVNNYNYTLRLLDNRITDILISFSHLNVTVNGTIERLTDVRSDLSVIVKLYDINGNVLSEKRQDFNKDNYLDKIGDFSIVFELTDTLNKDNVDSYSIEIVE